MPRKRRNTVGRPPDRVPSVRIPVMLTLKPGQDDDLIEYLLNAENKAVAVISAMRGGLVDYTIDVQPPDDAELINDLNDMLSSF